MLCPVCKAKRSTSVELAENLRAVSCGGCGGHWISNQNYTTWLEGYGNSRPEEPFSEVEFDVNDVQAVKLCPDCGRLLLKYKVGHGLDFSVDHCSGCGGVWLDANEWNALRGKNLHDAIHKIFTTQWQTQVRKEQVAATLDQVYQKRLGVEAYQKTKEIRTWIQNHDQKEAILAFISDNDPYKI